MVTHRRSLLALMDTVYVLEDGMLTNVNNLGGLDYYLGMLEGKTQAQIEAEIADDQNYLLPEALDEHIGLQDAAQPIQQVVPEYQTAEVNDSAEYADELSVDNFEEGPALDQTTSDDAIDDDSEVVVRLR